MAELVAKATRHLAQPGQAGLRFQLGAEMNTGLTDAQTTDIIAMLGSKEGRKEAESESALLAGVFGDRKQH